MPALLLVHAAAAGATTLRYLDTRELTLDSDDIVIGRVEQARSHWDPAHRRILTDVTVKVTRSLKGDAVENVTLVQLGGVVDGVRYTIPGGPTFSPGEEALLFVWRDARGRAQVNGLGQGKFDIRRDPVTGEQTVQRTLPGFGVRDARSLGPVPEALPLPRITLVELVREIERTLAQPER